MLCIVCLLYLLWIVPYCLRAVSARYASRRTASTVDGIQVLQYLYRGCLKPCGAINITYIFSVFWGYLKTCQQDTNYSSTTVRAFDFRLPYDLPAVSASLTAHRTPQARLGLLVAIIPRWCFYLIKLGTHHVFSIQRRRFRQSMLLFAVLLFCAFRSVFCAF